MVTTIVPDLPPAPGMTLVPGGATFCVYAGHADTVWACLYDTGDTAGTSERRIELTERAHGWWYGFLEGVGPGQRYNVRVDGPWDPDNGHRHNVEKVLLDPYAKAIEGDVTWGPEVFGHRVDDHFAGDDGIISPLDSRGHVPRCVVVDDSFDWGGVERPNRPLVESVLYEVHVKEMTRLHPDVPEHLRGTYAGMAHPAVIAHLQRMGVTTVELLPVQAHVDERELVQRGSANHWGYNTIGFFAPQASLASSDDPHEVLREFKGMVRLLHEAGIEVILDVVYNHSGEQSVHGATLAFRGLDGRAYYRLDGRGRDIDVTGCGNTMDLRHPVVARLVLDSLRHWVTEYHVDGFRFDLAVALGRGRNDEYDPDHPFLVALRTDPVLSRVKLIAEPWDVGMHGWRTGQFPPPFSEWNDRYRDGMRTFWLTDLDHAVTGEEAHSGHGVREVATRLAGSDDLFGTRDRGPRASVNFVTAHDGFTLADLTAYEQKHNEANGEDNRDGSSHNRSFNHGVEGPTDDEAILTRRRRSMRNLLGSLLLSTGVPMLSSGDEYGRSTLGNNNTYNQDNELTWLRWEHEPWEEDLLETTAFLSRLRREKPALHQRRFFSGRTVNEDGSRDLAWFGADGQEMSDGAWADPSAHTLQMYLNGAWIDAESILLVIHGGPHDTEVTLPSPPGLSAYSLLWDSAAERPAEAGAAQAPGPVTVTGSSLRVYCATDPT
ncbi:glycogen debranching protein GlgX [Janibacter sp. G1551]|uniref:glycogen debranching protein GlgX n=1 Tax=Janibacter sp. G1551 TaxID=3420440 RepID=UPI003CFD176F